ncbi:MAG TPA: hypothetical protein VMC43_01440 [Candidatus Paceibacterota bacterium]|nr:hypothetical protein [Candidatus Paceibacterota bacterium]
MNDKYQKLFSYIDRPVVPVGLLDKILVKIEVAEQRRARFRAVIYGILAMVGLAALIPAGWEFFAELNASGFTQFASLAFSDAGTLLVAWQDFLLSLVESFPIIGTAAVLGSVFVFLSSLRAFLRDVGPALHRSHLVHA